MQRIWPLFSLVAHSWCSLVKAEGNITSVVGIRTICQVKKQRSIYSWTVSRNNPLTAKAFTTSLPSTMLFNWETAIRNSLTQHAEVIIVGEGELDVSKGSQPIWCMIFNRPLRLFIHFWKNLPLLITIVMMHSIVIRIPFFISLHMFCHYNHKCAITTVNARSARNESTYKIVTTFTTQAKFYFDEYRVVQSGLNLQK